MKITIVIDTATFPHDNIARYQEGSMLDTARVLSDLSIRFAAGSWPMDGPVVNAEGHTIADVDINTD